MTIITIIVIIAAGFIAIVSAWFVHCGLERCYVRYGHRFCTKRGFTITKVRCGPEFEDSGAKTEYSVVEFDCVNPDGARKLVKLRVWIFGIKKVLGIEEFPEEKKD